MAENLTDRQAKWFATIRDGLERDTGKSIDAWAAIARTCPETKHRARLKWFKEEHGLLQNRASIVLEHAFEGQTPWSQPDALAAALWTDPGSRAILEAVRAIAIDKPGAIETQRKGYTAWSRKVQFAALKPLKGGGALLGLALKPNDGSSEASGREGWSERLLTRIQLHSPEEVANLGGLIDAAWYSS